MVFPGFPFLELGNYAYVEIKACISDARMIVLSLVFLQAEVGWGGGGGALVSHYAPPNICPWARL